MCFKQKFLNTNNSLTLSSLHGTKLYQLKIIEISSVWEVLKFYFFNFSVIWNLKPFKIHRIYWVQLVSLADVILCRQTSTDFPKFCIYFWYIPAVRKTFIKTKLIHIDLCPFYNFSWILIYSSWVSLEIATFWILSLSWIRNHHNFKFSTWEQFFKLQANKKEFPTIISLWIYNNCKIKASAVKLQQFNWCFFRFLHVKDEAENYINYRIRKSHRDVKKKMCCLSFCDPSSLSTTPQPWSLRKRKEFIMKANTKHEKNFEIFCSLWLRERSERREGSWNKAKLCAGS